jgi:HAD superfamily hydrolase (TIGR01450 family)
MSGAAAAAYEAVGRSHGVMLDWDGCIAFHDRPTDAALRFLREHWHHAAIVSNNSTLRPEEFSHILASEGILITPDRIFLAGAEALCRAKEIDAARVMVIGAPRMKAYARTKGINVVRDDADLVVLMRDPRFSFAKLERAANSLRAGAKLVVSNPDLTHPGLNGRIVPETGALLAALRASIGSAPIDIEIIGKPSQRLFEKACRALSLRPEQALMIGDNPDTDGAGAQALGAPWVMVGGRSEVTFDDLLYDPARGKAVW